jgi:hypothetical protein
MKKIKIEFTLEKQTKSFLLEKQQTCPKRTLTFQDSA